MTELAVAIVVLGIVLVGLFPLMVDSIRLSQSNAQVGQANQVVSSNIDFVRSGNVGGSCATGTFSGTTPKGSLFVAATTGLAGDITFSCPDAASSLVTVRVDVWSATDAAKRPLSTATTKVVSP